MGGRGDTSSFLLESPTSFTPTLIFHLTPPMASNVRSGSLSMLLCRGSWEGQGVGTHTLPLAVGTEAGQRPVAGQHQVRAASGRTWCPCCPLPPGWEEKTARRRLQEWVWLLSVPPFPGQALALGGARAGPWGGGQLQGGHGQGSGHFLVCFWGVCANRSLSQAW